jgi:hypothetical protein
MIMKLPVLAALAATLAAHAAAAQEGAPGPQWASVTPAQARYPTWMDTSSVEAVGPDRFRARLLLFVPGLPIPLQNGAQADRALSHVEFDCTQRTSELLSGDWRMGEKVVYTLRPSGRAEPWRVSRSESSELQCQLARRITGAGGGPANPAGVSP